MTLSLLPAKIAVGVNIKHPFQGVGGVEPYVYSLLSGVGSINASSGLYTAPALVPNADSTPTVVRVTDANLDTADSNVVVLTPLELLCEIIQNQMGLPDGRVYLWDQNIRSPSDQDLFIAVGIISSKPFANNRQMVPGAGLDELQSINVLDMVSVDIISKDRTARDRKEEVLLAINSTYSQQQQELNSFRIGIISESFVNLSQVDGSAIPYRFNISLNIQYSVTKTRAVEYYDDFMAPEVTADP